MRGTGDERDAIGCQRVSVGPEHRP
jgi:hypothetical protein